jgi:vacuole morphology and inheritance protein 14
MHQPHGVPASGPSSSISPQQQQQQQQQQQPQQQQPYSPYAIPNEQQSASPLPPMVQRSLGDRSNEKRKNAALEIEALIKSLHEANNMNVVNAIINVLSRDFCTSMNSNYRKGGLVGLAATAIGLAHTTPKFLHVLLPPVLHCFDDPESRVRYYACESLYNMAKVSRQAILAYFNQIFEGLTKLFADVDVDVKNGANLLDRLIKDIVTEAESDTFQVDQFLPVIQNYIRRTNPYIRQLIVGWITLLDSLPDISMLDYLPDFLDGLFNMLSDSNREIRQAADSALSDFLRELSASQVLEFGPIISILVFQCRSKERLNRLTSITWLAELTHHPLSGGDAILPYLPEILSAILYCISDHEKEIRLVAERTNDDLLQLVKETKGSFDLRPLLEALTSELLEKEDVPTKISALRWINMLMEKRMQDMQTFTVNILPVLLRTLSDPSDAVVLLDLQVLSRISLAVANETAHSAHGRTTLTTSSSPSKLVDGEINVDRSSNDGLFSETEDAQFQLVLNAILNLFAQDRELLETRGSLIIRKLCVLLNAKMVYIRMAETLSSYEKENPEQMDHSSSLQFISTMVQTLNLILLTASELHDLRSVLAHSFEDPSSSLQRSHSLVDESDCNAAVFATLFHCW